ncbi:unnamed protein product [marine sediment metagenome]|uniref:DUF362 domain-containing protein n=1 Tax=marine sediment metagenome TaxID=412755 RepID=X1DJL0_9ZZZZ
MRLDRRSFIISSVIAGSGLMLSSMKAMSMQAKAADSLFGLHPFVQGNPDAVFIMKTSVDIKTNAKAMKAAGLSFGRSVMGLTDDTETGVPLSNKFTFKPNLTCRARWHEKYTVERSMGIVTDASFMEGIIESMKELGISGSQFYGQ